MVGNGDDWCGMPLLDLREVPVISPSQSSSNALPSLQSQYTRNHSSGEVTMHLGAFSLSLAVQDLAVSRSFYEKLGFQVTGGDEERFLILVNGTTVIGLFQGLFEKNVLTFNPGLAQDMSRIADFTDVRDIRASLLAGGIEMESDTDPDATGPASIIIKDPDGNPVLIDQYFPKPTT